jgi:hypothetical protein
MSTLAAGYALLLAAMVIVIWLINIARGAVPELITEPRAIRFHIAAELGMAALLVAGGALTLAGSDAGTATLLLAFGAVLYSIVNSAGHYAQLRQVAPLVVFGTLFVLTAAAAVALAIG